MTARRDRAVAHGCLLGLARVLDEGRWPADGTDLFEAALTLTARRSLVPRRAVVVLAVILLLVAAGGTRCGDAYRSDRTTTVVTR